MVYVLLAPGFEEIEALSVVDILRRAELEVTTVGVGVAGQTVTGVHGIEVMADIHEDDLHLTDVEMVVLPGGQPGTANLERSATVRSAVEAAAVRDAWLAAICAAPSILAHWGMLKGRRATCYPGYDRELTGSGAVYTDAQVEQDGRTVTAKGPGAAILFGLRLVACLRNEDTAERIRRAMQYDL